MHQKFVHVYLCVEVSVMLPLLLFSMVSITFFLFQSRISVRNGAYNSVVNKQASNKTKKKKRVSRLKEMLKVWRLDQI